MSTKKAPPRIKKIPYVVFDLQDSNAACFEAASAEEAARVWFREMTDGGDSPSSVELKCYVVPLDQCTHYKASISIEVKKVEKK